MSDTTIPLAALGLVSAVLALVVTPLFKLLRQQDKTHQKIALALDKNTASNRDIAKETRQGNEEAKERNGHLAELVIQTSENTVEALKSVKEQKVQEQTVAHQVVKETK